MEIVPGKMINDPHIEKRLDAIDASESPDTPMNRLAAPFSITSHASCGGLLIPVSFRTISEVMEKGIFEKTLYIPLFGKAVFKKSLLLSFRLSFFASDSCNRPNKQGDGSFACRQSGHLF